MSLPSPTPSLPQTTLHPLTPITLGYFTALAASAFVSDPFTRRFISENDGLGPGVPISHQRRTEHFKALLQRGVEGGGQIVEAGRWGAGALW
ncbi:hypothetical protein MMC12_000456 [Toensbergia leucococca]|nr:hypothetical protein [Toensbergia leucococca]